MLLHKLSAKFLQLADGFSALVTTVDDLTMANYGLERGLNDENCAASYDDIKAYIPEWRAAHRCAAGADDPHRTGIHR